MVREVLTISVGQGGVQLGNSIWKQYCAEHNIDCTGQRAADAPEDAYFGCFFEESSDGNFVPRNLAVDLDPMVIGEIRRGKFGGMYHPEYLIDGVEDAANIFARGHYTVGKEKLDVISDRIRRMMDRSENVQGFLVNHTVGGGTGSGLGSLILESLKVNSQARKKATLGFEIYPSPTLSTCIVEPYNALLTSHWLTDMVDVSIMLDNEALYTKCQKNLKIKCPSYCHINNIIAKVASSVTASIRFEGELNTDLDEFLTNLVPFPRLHFMTPSFAPLRSIMNAEREEHTVRSLTDECLNPSNFLVSLPDFDIQSDPYMAVALNFRGNVGHKEVNQAIEWIKNNPKTKFVEWSPCGWKIGLNDVPAASFDEDCVGATEREAIMLANNVAISRAFGRICKKFDCMLSQRAYVHWYVGEGMEEGEFEEAREDIAWLQKDFEDAVDSDVESDTDDWDGEEHIEEEY